MKYLSDASFVRGLHPREMTSGSAQLRAHPQALPSKGNLLDRVYRHDTPTQSRAAVFATKTRQPSSETGGELIHKLIKEA
jgi:hypothetical protein